MKRGVRVSETSEEIRLGRNRWRRRRGRAAKGSKQGNAGAAVEVRPTMDDGRWTTLVVGGGEA